MASTISLNVANFVTLKLTPENYPLWREQLLALAESQDMVGLLTGEIKKPTMYKNNTTTAGTSITDTATNTLSDEYLRWRKEDRLLRGWIIGTLTEEALGLVIGLESSQSVWNALKEAYAQDSQEREFTLRQQLTYLRKDPNQSLAEYLRKFKSICDSLAAIGNPVPDKTKVYSLLANLGQKYESFTTAMLKPPMPSYSEAVSLLQGNGSQQLQKANNHTPRPPPPGKRRMTSTEREMYKNEHCQLCGRPGHIAKICWSLPNQSVNDEDLPQALAALTMDTSVPDVEWTTDTGASNHMTANSVFIGDGSHLKIDVVGDVVVSDDPTSPVMSSELPSSQSHDHTSTNIDLEFSPQEHDMSSSIPLPTEDSNSVSIPPASLSDPISSISHTMATRAKHGIYKPNPRYALLLTSGDIPSEPRTTNATSRRLYAAVEGESLIQPLLISSQKTDYQLTLQVGNHSRRRMIMLRRPSDHQLIPPLHRLPLHDSSTGN
nr:Retrovirus-related Pol polyprotein from transposon TNT 1-94 [Ipomoea batatas]